MCEYNLVKAKVQILEMFIWSGIRKSIICEFKSNIYIYYDFR